MITAVLALYEALEKETIAHIMVMLLTALGVKKIDDSFPGYGTNGKSNKTNPNTPTDRPHTSA